MLRGWSDKARQEECEAITGAIDASIASRQVWSEAWETSTIVPSRFISRTTSRPKSVSPGGPSSEPELPAQGVGAE